MRLQRLTLRNFKAVRQFTLDANGDNLVVYGTNSSGKTSLADAYSWLLFGKDSLNQTNFDIKTLDENNHPIHGLEHEVEGVFTLADGRKVSLRKVYKEKWVKARGSAKSELKGHTTDYFIDDVPVKKSEYDAFVDSIGSEDTFRLLSDPLFFNQHLHWEQRRKILMDVLGNITDADVIASDKGLARLPEILGNRSVEDHKKVIAARRTKINDELQKIPVRIDEVDRNLPEPPAEDKPSLEARLAAVRSELEAKKEARLRIQSGGEIAEKQKRLAQIEAEQQSIVSTYRRKREDAVASLHNKAAELSQQRSIYQSDIVAKQNANAFGRDQIARWTKRMEELRHQWHTENDKQFIHEQAESCPACGQAIPEEQLQVAHDEALALFNKQKAERLASINEEGRTLKQAADDMEANIARTEAEIDDLQAKVNDLNAQIAELHRAIENLHQTPNPVNQDPQWWALEQEKVALQSEIETLCGDVQPALEKVNTEINALNDQVVSLQTEIGKFILIEQGQNRIAELQAEEKRLSAEYERLEEELFLTEEFTRAKVRLLEDRINSRFKIARFRLFEEQVNGGLREVCDVMLNGVPWHSINNGGRIQVGLDVIATLSQHYGFAPPVWIDNAESVVDIPPTPGQQIHLVVSAEDKELRVERLGETTWDDLLDSTVVQTIEAVVTEAFDDLGDEMTGTNEGQATLF